MTSETETRTTDLDIKEKNNSDSGYTLYAFLVNGELSLVPLKVRKDDPDDPYTKLVNDKIEEVKGKKTRLESGLTETLSEKGLTETLSKRIHSRRRSQREKRDIRKSYEEHKVVYPEEIARLEEDLQVLRGKSERPVRIYRNSEGRFTEIDTRGLEPAQSGWWDYLKGNVELKDMMETNTDDFRLIQKAFSLRFNIKYGDSTEQERARQVYFGNFLNVEIGDRKDLDRHLRSIMSI